MIRTFSPRTFLANHTTLISPKKSSNGPSPQKYTISDDSVTAPVLDEKTYLEHVANALGDRRSHHNTQLSEDNKAVLKHLHTQKGIQPREAWNLEQAPREVQGCLEKSATVAQDGVAPQSRPTVTLKRITAHKFDPRQRKILADLAQMHDKKAWLWPFSRLKSFVARKANLENATGPTPLADARRLSPNEVMHKGESRFAVHPTSYDIVELEPSLEAPQLDSERAMLKHIKYHQSEQGRVFYAIESQFPNEKEITGFLFLEPRENGARDVQIFVGEQYRGQGIATAAIGELAKTVKQQYVHTNALNYVPEATNYGSRNVAQKSGFTLQDISIDDVAPKWQLARDRQNPVEVNLTYTLSNLESDNKARARFLASCTALKYFTKVQT